MSNFANAGMGMPRIITLVVGDDICPTHIGDFITEKAHNLLIEIGPKAILPKSISLRPISERVYVLSYETFMQFSVPKELKEQYANAQAAVREESTEDRKESVEEVRTNGKKSTKVARN